MRWFERGNGLWRNPKAGYLYWWQSANMLSAISDLAMLNPDVKASYSYVWDDVYRNAPKNNPMPVKVKRSDGTWGKNYTFPSPLEVKRGRSKRAEVGFRGRFYDDEGWWGLAFVAALDVTGRREYLDEAIGIWYDMKDGWNKHHCGGIPWNKDDGQAPVPIANGQYLHILKQPLNEANLGLRTVYPTGCSIV
jgi:hypothetical protein